MLRTLLILALCTFVQLSHAGSCRPERMPTVEVVTSAGVAWAWWRTAPLPTGQTSVTWNRCTFAALFSEIDPIKFLSAARRVVLATDQDAQFEAEMLAATKVPPVGSVAEYDLARLHWLACLEVVKLPYPEPGNWVALNPSVCGASPTPPQPPTTSWVTAGSSSYDTLNGALSSYTGSVVKGLPCDDTIPAIQVGASTYKHFQGAAKPTIVARCTLRAL